MAKKKQEDDEKEKKEDFNIDDAFQTVNPYMIDGFKKFIFYHKIDITNQKEFNKILKEYGGC